MQRLSARVGTCDDQLERFIRQSPWDFERLQEHLAGAIPPSIHDPRGVLVVDEVSLAKRGRHSVGVHRPDRGAPGRARGHQVAVGLTYAAAGAARHEDPVTWPLGMRLYLPPDWIDDAARRKDSGIPDGIAFQAKHQIALALLDRARAHGVKHACVAGKACQGDNEEFRKALRDRKEPYVLEVTPSLPRVVAAKGTVHDRGKAHASGRSKRTVRSVPRSPSQIAQRVKQWTRLGQGRRDRDTPPGEFHRVRVHVAQELQPRATDEEAWLLLEKSGTGLKAYLCWGMDAASLGELVEWARLGGATAPLHKATRTILRLERFEGRTWTGWHHHATMVLLAHAFLATQRTHAPRGQPLPSLRAAVRGVMLEIVTQRLSQSHQLPREKAKQIALMMLRGYVEL